ncbi:uncharacterized protein LOC118192959 [Stegodyphus dumicola]|uniref:uncharacterized protein LOC118192959 n=1 Tax=Stegodyphus dumicola TaxID=202533 RepID=UPI0015B0D153|nr:uncharacterized protein LOC118192959 [Stegodyphus dumicola]
MDEEDDDAFYSALKCCYDKLETAIESKCNMNQNIREEARHAMCELKCLITKNFERIKSLGYREACRESLKDIFVKPTYASAVLPSPVDNVKQRPSYASVVAPSDVTRINEKSLISSDCCLIVDSENCSSDDVKKVIKLKINPLEAKLGVYTLKNIGKDKVLVKCLTENDRNRLQAEINEKSPELNTSLPKKRNPVLLVKNVPNEIPNEDLLKVIFEQNPEVVESDENRSICSVRFTLKTFQFTRHVVIETHPMVRKRILNQARLKINWSICETDDFIIINRCFKCLGYNHRADECRERTACFNCSGEHKAKDCSNRNAVACINCIRFNHKTNNSYKKVNVNHKPFSECCPSHEFMRKNIQSRIDYG